MLCSMHKTAGQPTLSAPPDCQHEAGVPSSGLSDDDITYRRKTGKAIIVISIMVAWIVILYLI